MAVLQALLAFIGRSAGKVLNAVFGWAVRALFGGTTGSQTFLTGLVAAAALWPLLLIGVVAPRAAAFLLAFIPIPKSVPAGAIRMVWLGLAIVLPAILGLALATKAPADAPPESFLTRLLRGYPTTLGIALAFLISFLSVPFLRIASMLRGHSDTDIPLVTTRESYDQVAQLMQRVLNERGFDLVAVPAGFWVSAPMRVMRALCGAAVRNYIPDRIAHFRGRDIEVALYSASILLRGPVQKTVLAQGLLLEALTATTAFQTTAPAAQELERQIHRVWAAFADNPSAHTDSFWLHRRVDEIKTDLLQLEVGHDDWQTIYRQLLQLARALGGEPQLFVEDGGTLMDPTTSMQNDAVPGAVRQMSTVDILGEIAARANDLLAKEIELARSEMRQQLSDEITMIKGVAVAAVAALIGVNLLFVAAIFALASYMAAWAAALSLAAVMLVAAAVLGAIAWRKHVTRPLERTRRTLTEDVHWVQEELA